MIVEDDAGNILEVADDAIKATTDNKDGSYTFKCIGGPLHGGVLRVYLPFEPVVLPYPTGDVTYTLHPPVRKGGKWVFVHQGESE